MCGVGFERPGAATDRVAVRVVNRKNQPVAEAVVESNAAFLLNREPGQKNFLLGVPALAQKAAQYVPRVRRVAQLELGNGRVADPALLEVVPSPSALRRFGQQVVPKVGRQLQQIKQPVLLAGQLRILRDEGNAGFLGQQPQGLAELDVFDFLDERKNVAALAAAEAVPDLLVARRHKRRRLFLMERTRRFPVGPRLLEHHVLTDDVHDVETGFDFVNLTGHT